MRLRKITFRYTEVVGGLSRAFEAETWACRRPQPMASPLFRPPADVIETDDAYLVILELSGVDEEDVEILVHPDALVVFGRRRCQDPPGARYHAAEIRYGPFRFDMEMPRDADADRVDACSERGLVRIRVARRTGGNS